MVVVNNMYTTTLMCFTSAALQMLIYALLSQRTVLNTLELDMVYTWVLLIPAQYLFMYEAVQESTCIATVCM